MKKITDWLMTAFAWAYSLFICSLALPLFFGVIILFITPLAYWFKNHMLVYVITSIAVGLFITIRIGKKKGSKV